MNKYKILILLFILIIINSSFLYSQQPPLPQALIQYRSQLQTTIGNIKLTLTKYPDTTKDGEITSTISKLEDILSKLFTLYRTNLQKVSEDALYMIHQAPALYIKFKEISASISDKNILYDECKKLEVIGVNLYNFILQQQDIISKSLEDKGKELIEIGKFIKQEEVKKDEVKKSLEKAQKSLERVIIDIERIGLEEFKKVVESFKNLFDEIEKNLEET